MSEERMNEVLAVDNSENIVESMNEEAGVNVVIPTDSCRCDFTAGYCSTEKVPSFFNNNLSRANGDNRIAYDPTCLNATVETCEIQVPCPTGSTPRTVTIYTAVIKGCMPYQAEGRFNNPAPCNEPSSGGSNIAIVTQGTVCFDNAVDFGSLEEMEGLRDCINGLLANPSTACKLITNTRNPLQLRNCGGNFSEIPPQQATRGRCSDRLVRFSGTFTISNNFLQSRCPIA